MLTPNDTATLLARTKGAAASILLAMLCLGKPLARRDLITLTPYSPPSIDRAMRDLETMGIVQRHPGGQWMLTVQGRQFILGETGLVLESTSQPALPADSCQNAATNVKNFYIPTNSNVVTTNPLTVETTSLPSGEKLFTFDNAAEETVILLTTEGRWEHTKNGKGARDSVTAALTAGWTGQECLDCVEGWLAYAETKKGHWITDPPGFAAHALREQRRPPTPKEATRVPKPEDYISGEFAHLIKH